MVSGVALPVSFVTSAARDTLTQLLLQPWLETEYRMYKVHESELQAVKNTVWCAVYYTKSPYQKVNTTCTGTLYRKSQCYR